MAYSNLIPREDLEEIILHAKTRNWGPSNTPTDYSKPANIVAYFVERSTQLCSHIGSSADKENRIRLLRTLAFYNAVLGRVAYIEGAKAPSVYESFNDPETGKNQVDFFLESVGYSKKREEK